MEDTRGFVLLDDGRKEVFPEGITVLHRGSLNKFNVIGINSKIVELAIPATVFLIDRDCFRDCSHLKKVSFAPSKNGSIELTAIMERAFQGCTALDNFDFAAAPLNFIGENAFSNTGFTHLDLIDNDHLCYIGAFAFSDCQKLMKASVRSEVIAPSCFAECQSLIKLELKDCQCIGANAFLKCDDLTKVNVRGGKRIELISATGNKDLTDAMKS